MSLNPGAAILTSDIVTVSSKDFRDIQATKECSFTLKRVHDTTKTYSQILCTYKYSQHSSIIGKASLAEWLSVLLRTKWLWVRILLKSLKKNNLVYLFFQVFSKLVRKTFAFSNMENRQRSKTLHKKWNFPLRISSVNLTKSAENCGFGDIYWTNP